ncbi:hypothetical protein [Ancylobacter lacus]|uniref:hypothetical protein n=1 Tax=Ancylobacter lacus TaxID=2579970 RepID=UPI001BCEC8A9|nr:hypothetical protein [Ancylobacter lacus]MBS7537464.1 hypothetical protein [Ancylobacter lacus]
MKLLRAMARLRALALVLALLAVGAGMPAPALAAARMLLPVAQASAAMPCHEGAAPVAGAPQDGAVMPLAANPLAAKPVAVIPVAMPDPAGGHADSRHLCCALACFILAPAPGLVAPGPALNRAGWHAPAPAALVGVRAALPEPPPRYLA